MYHPDNQPALIARAPLRISFAGGGTDLPAYYTQFGGLVLNATISPSVYAALTPLPDKRVSIITFKHRIVLLDGSRFTGTVGDDQSLPRQVLKEMGVERGLNISLFSDAPPGTGLGSSSSIAVALITAIATYQGETLTPGEVAELASHIEIQRLGQPIGKQDQYAAAFGGINMLSFAADAVQVTPLDVSPAVWERLETHLALYFTGSTRQARTILQEQRGRTSRGDAQTLKALHALKACVQPVHDAIMTGDIRSLGALLHEAWLQKRRVSSGITTTAIDEAYEAACAAGAWGGKITGAGGGGFLLLAVPLAAQERVRQTLAKLNLHRMPFSLEPLGAHVMSPTAQIDFLSTWHDTVDEARQQPTCLR